MKWLFLLLLAANLALYFWPSEDPNATDQAGQPGEPASPAEQAADDAPTILLIEEARQQNLYPRAEDIAAHGDTTEVRADASSGSDGDGDGDGGENPSSNANTQSSDSNESRLAAARDRQPPKPANDDRATQNTAPPAPSNPSPTSNSPPPASAPAAAAAVAVTAPVEPAKPPPSTQPAATETSTASNAEPQAAPTTPAATETANQRTSSPPATSPTAGPDSDSSNRSGSSPDPETTTSSAATSATTDPAADNQQQCFRLGPFETLVAASMAKQETMDLGFSGRLLQSTRGSVSYQVLLGPYDDPDERAITMNELFDAGVGDILIGEGGNHSDLVAGNYPSRKAAAEKMDQLAQLGYRPRLAKQSRPQKRFYLDLNTPNSSGSPPAAEVLKQEFPDIDLHPGRCRPSTPRK